MSIGYEQRRQSLRELGYASYADYLESPLWQSIRKRALKRDKGLCRVCSDAVEHVHHRDYQLKTLHGLSLDGLWSLCAVCHEYIEFPSPGHKGTLETANKRLDMLADFRFTQTQQDEIPKNQPRRWGPQHKCAVCGKKLPRLRTKPRCKKCHYKYRLSQKQKQKSGAVATVPEACPKYVQREQVCTTI